MVKIFRVENSDTDHRKKEIHYIISLYTSILVIVLFSFFFMQNCPAGNIHCLRVIPHYMDCSVLSAYNQMVRHCIHNLCVRTTLQNHKWHWTLSLSFYYSFFHPAFKTPAFTDKYLNPAYKLSLTCVNKFPVLCITSVYCVDQNLDCSHECYPTSYQGFPHSKHLIYRKIS